jgi:hypothetical protein
MAIDSVEAKLDRKFDKLDELMQRLFVQSSLATGLCVLTIGGLPMRLVRWVRAPAGRRWRDDWARRSRSVRLRR